MSDKYYAKVSTSSEIGKIMGMAWQILEKYGSPSADKEYAEAVRVTVENFINYYQKSEYSKVVEWLGMAIAEYLLINHCKAKGGV